MDHQHVWSGINAEGQACCPICGELLESNVWKCPECGNESVDSLARQGQYRCWRHPGYLADDGTPGVKLVRESLI